MPTRETLESFIAKVEINAHDQAIAEFYAENALLRENQAEPRIGRDNAVACEREILDRTFKPRRKAVVMRLPPLFKATLLLFAALLIGFLNCPRSYAATYTISSNADFAKYFGFNPTVQLKPGDTVQIADGTYTPTVENPTWQTVVLWGINGTPNSWITVTAAPGAHPVLNVGGNGIFEGICLTNCSYIHISGLELSGVDPNTNKSEGLSTSIYSKGAAHDIQFVGNVVHGFGGNGISTTCSQTLIEGNTVYGCCRWDPSGASGIHPWEPTLDWTDNSAFGTANGELGNPGNQYVLIVRNNTVYDCQMLVPEVLGSLKFGRPVDGNGIQIDDFQHFQSDNVPFGDASHRTLVANNVVYDSGGAGISVFHSSHVDVFNNTLYHNCQVDQYTYELPILESDSTDDKAFNNLVDAAGTGNDTNGFAVVNGASAGYGNNADFGASNYTPCVGDVDGVDPRFVSPSITNSADFHLLASSPMFGKGVVLSQVTFDHDDHPRGHRNDIGAYSISPSAAVDAPTNMSGVKAADSAGLPSNGAVSGSVMVAELANRSML